MFHTDISSMRDDQHYALSTHLDFLMPMACQICLAMALLSILFYQFQNDTNNTALINQMTGWDVNLKQEKSKFCEY